MDTVKVEMTPEEFARYKQAMEEQSRRDLAQRAKAEREAYRSLAATTVDEFFPRLESTSNTLSKMKRLLYDSFSQVVETKREVMGAETQGQRSHSFLSTDGTKRIIIGYYQRDGWDETVEDGIAKVRDYISSLAGDEETRKLVDIILDLLSRDGKGNLKADKVLQLDKYAESIQDARFSEGVAIIKEAYRPVRTKDFVRAQTKNAMGGWDDLPLGMTEA